MEKVLKTAESPYQTFHIVEYEFGNGGKYAIRYVGKESKHSGYVLENAQNIKTWKTTTGVTRYWLKFLKEHGAKII